VETLPPGASAASQRRYALACELARLCPSHLGQEIALTGSTSLGLADDHSDIELNFWGETIPSPAARRQWLAAAGATDITLDEHQIADGSFWVTCRFRGIWIEVGWQSIKTQEELLQAILAGDFAQHERLLLGFVIQHAVPLRSNSLLDDWQTRLTQYPDALQARLIEGTRWAWMFPHILLSWWALPQRDERLRLHGILVRELHNALRVLFAINRQWEPEWKWIAHITGGLAIKPERLAERINEVFSSPPEQSLRLCLQLIAEILRLVPPPYDVSLALATIEQSLSTHQ
jgi:hypothetical protein